MTGLTRLKRLTSLAALAASGVLAAPAGILGQAQQTTPPASAQTPAPAAPAQSQTGYERLIVTAGRSMVLTEPFDIKRVTITNPDIADATGVSARELLIDG